MRDRRFPRVTQLVRAQLELSDSRVQSPDFYSKGTQLASKERRAQRDKEERRERGRKEGRKEERGRKRREKEREGRKKGGRGMGRERRREGGKKEKEREKERKVKKLKKNNLNAYTIFSLHAKCINITV